MHIHTLSACLMATIILVPRPEIRSIAPPIPFTILPWKKCKNYPEDDSPENIRILTGTIQLARSPFIETCIPPRTVVPIWPLDLWFGKDREIRISYSYASTYPRIMENDSSLLNREAPGFMVTAVFPALIKSGSACPRFGKSP